MIDAAVLTSLLPAYLPRQRWYGAVGRELVSAEVVSFEVHQKEWPALAWALCEARFADGGSMTYQVFIGARPIDPPIDFLHGKEKVTLGTAEVGGEAAILYDALVDPELAVIVLHMVEPSAEVNIPRPIVLEHSNSSLVFDERLILKLFRKVVPGRNPDSEITKVLADHGYPHVIPPVSELRREDTDLAVLREYLVGSTEGWSLAHTSLRDMLASRLPPGECGGDFAPEAERLGDMIGRMHIALAAALGVEPGDGDRWVDRMLEHLETVDGPFDEADVRARYDLLRGLADPGPSIRIHGDLHLSQVLRADSGWFVIDFEGEPSRRAQATETSSALRDVAGMLRSFHYAAQTGLKEWGDDVDDELIALADDWEERNARAFLTTYYATEGIDAVLPTTEAARATVLAAFELDKAVYEVGYEIGHRPEWVDIPLGAIERILAR